MIFSNNKSNEKKIKESFLKVRQDIEDINKKLSLNQKINNSIEEWLLYLNNRLKAIEQQQQKIQQDIEEMKLKPLIN